MFFCGAAIETTKHLMLECFVSQITWGQSPWGLNILAFLDQPLSSWLKTIIESSSLSTLPCEDHSHFQLFALISWDILW